MIRLFVQKHHRRRGRLLLGKGLYRTIISLYLGKIFLLLVFIFFSSTTKAQQESEFKKLSLDSSKTEFYKLFVTGSGKTMILNSKGLWMFDNGKLTGPVISTQEIYKVDSTFPWHIFKPSDDLSALTRGSLAEGPDGCLYFIAYDKLFIWKPGGKINIVDWPPYRQTSSRTNNLQSLRSNSERIVPVLKIWVDSYGKIYIGTAREGFSIIDISKTIDYEKNSNDIMKVEFKGIKTTLMGSVYSFAQDPKNRDRIWIGTNSGLFYYNSNQGTGTLFPVYPGITVTEVFAGVNDNIWFSTRQKGMGVYNLIDKNVYFFPYKKENDKLNAKSSVQTFCFKSTDEFFVATSTLAPAIFNIKNHTYSFISDSVLLHNSNQVDDIKVDPRGNLLLLKGTDLYYSSLSVKNMIENTTPTTTLRNDTISQTPFIKGIELPDGTPLATLDYHPELLKKIVLNPLQNNLIVYYDINDFGHKRNFHFAWKVDGYTQGWVLFSRANPDNFPMAYLSGLRPGTYRFQLKITSNDYNWQSRVTELVILITTPIWQQWWFWAAIVVCVAMLIPLVLSGYVLLLSGNQKG